MAKLLNNEEAAEALSIKPQTLRQWVWKRKIEFVRVGRAIRFKQETIDEIIMRGTVPAKDDEV